MQTQIPPANRWESNPRAATDFPWPGPDLPCKAQVQRYPRLMPAPPKPSGLRIADGIVWVTGLEHYRHGASIDTPIVSKPRRVSGATLANLRSGPRLLSPLTHCLKATVSHPIRIRITKSLRLTLPSALVAKTPLRVTPYPLSR